jgi:SAM-dependent methyltransferase
VTYQDVRLHGTTVDKGQRDCATRYALIKQALPKWTRPFTVLDLGAAQGYFGIRFAEDFDYCCSVMIDEGPQLAQILTANNLAFTVGLQTRLTEAHLEALADSEHLDVILALNILHHFPDPGRALRAVLRMGEEMFVEVPGPEDVAACGDSHEWLEDLVRAEGGVVLGAVASHTTPSTSRRLYHIRRQKAVLQRSYMGGSPPPLRMHQIVSTLAGKVWNVPEKNEARTWWPGINLQTYLTLGGVYPPRERIAQLVEKEVKRAVFGEGDIGLTGIDHMDIRPWNIILSGDAVTLIDWADDRQALELRDDREGLALTLKMIRGV